MTIQHTTNFTLPYPQLTDTPNVPRDIQALATAVDGLSIALKSGNLSQFAATTSAQLISIISDETGSGSLVFNTSPTINQAPSSIGLVVKESATAPGDLQQWQDSAGTVLANIASTGSSSFKSVTATATTSGTASLALVAASGQTANLLETAGGARITAAGNYFSAPGITARYTADFTAGAATVVAVTVVGAASQTANLQQWQNSAGTVLASVSNAGDISGKRVAITQTNAGQIVLDVLGAASQTADLQQWRNSAGTILGGANALTQIYTGSTSPILVATGGATTAASGDGTTATITTTSAHGLAVGDLVTVAGVTPTGYNGTFIVTAVASTTLSYANATTGVQTIAGTVSAPAQASVTSRSAGTSGLVVKGAASQTANLQQWQNSAGTVLASVRYDGLLFVPISTASQSYINGFYSNVQSAVTTQATNYVGLVIHGAASQTADLQQWQNTSGTVLSGVNAAGQYYAGSTTSVIGSGTTALTSAAYTSATVAVFTYAGTSLVQLGQSVVISGVTGGTYNGTWTVTAITPTTFTVLGSGFTNVAGTGGVFQLSAVGSFIGGTTAITPLVVQGSATAYLQEWQNAGGGFLAGILGNGGIRASQARIGTAGSLGTLTVNTTAAATIGAVIQGVASQTADLQQWQNSAGTVLSNVDSSGIVNGIAFRTTSGNSNQFGNGAVISGVLTAFGPGGNAAIVPVVVKGAASQTADLQEWQNSAGTVLASVSASGNITTPMVTISGTTTNATDVATKFYVDSIKSGFNMKEAVEAASTTDLTTLGTWGTVTYTAGSAGADGGTGVGATLTPANNGVFIIDNYTPDVPDRVLIKNQTDPKQNGVYTLSVLGTVGAKWTLTRSTDYDNNILGLVGPGDLFYVAGNAAEYSTLPTNNSTSWIMNNAAGTATGQTIKIGTDNIPFVQFTGAASSVTAGTGITVAGNVVSITAVSPTSTTDTSTKGIVSGHTVNTQGQVTTTTTTTLGTEFTNTTGTISLTTAGIANAKLTNSSITIGSSAAVSLGGSITTIAGLTLTTPTIATINGGGAATTPSLYPDVTTGAISIGAGITTGTVNIDASSTVSHIVNIGTGVTAGASTKTINIGTAGAAASNTVINIGSATAAAQYTTVALNGGLNFYQTGTQFLQIYNPSAGNVTMLTASAATAWNLNLNTGITTAATSGSLNLNTGSTATTSINTGAINIVTGQTSGATSNSGNVTIDSGAIITSGTAGSILIGTTTTPTITIGRASGVAVTINGTTMPASTTLVTQLNLQTQITNGITSLPAAALPSAGTITTAAQIGYMGMPQNTNPGAYTITAADNGKHIYYTTTGQTVTIPAAATLALPIGFSFVVINTAAVSTSIAITTDTMYLAGTGTTGTRTLAAYGMATVIKVAGPTSAGVWMISGNGLT